MNLQQVAETAVKASLIGKKEQKKDLRSSFDFALKTLNSAFPNLKRSEIKEALRLEVLKQKDKYEDMSYLGSLTAQTMFDKIQDERE